VLARDAESGDMGTSDEVCIRPPPDRRSKPQLHGIPHQASHGPKGGMSFDGLSGKAGGRFSKNDLMPSCASAPAARWPTQATSSVTASSGSCAPIMLHITRRLTAAATAE